MRDPLDIMAEAVRPLADGTDTDPREAARALVAALADARYVVAPREPTEEMLRASEEAGPPPPVPGGLSERQKAALIAYRAMIAPAPPRLLSLRPEEVDATAPARRHQSRQPAHGVLSLCEEHIARNGKPGPLFARCSRAFR